MPQPSVKWSSQQVPLQARIVVPLRPLAELIPHEQELLAGMAEHKPVQEAQIRELLPLIARHFTQHGTLPVDDLIVRERQNEIFGEGINQAKCNLAMLVTSEHWILRQVVQHVMHPAHIPFETESQSSHVSGPRDLRPSRRFFRHHHDVGKCRINMLIQLPQEVNRLYVFFSAIAVWYPLSLPPSIIEIEHGSDGIDPETVNVIFVEPEHGVADEKTLDFVPTVVEYKSVPVRLLPLSWVAVFVEMRAIEIAEARLIFWEVGRDPIEDDADSILMKAVDKVPEIVRRAESAGRSKIAGGLVSPGAVERMLHNWHEFDVGKTALPDIICQQRGHLPIAQPAIFFFGHTPPGA